MTHPVQPQSGYAHDSELGRLGARRIALSVLDMVFSTPEWIHRRTEQIVIVSETHFRRHVTLDLTIPSPCPATVRWFDDADLVLLPVDILRKQPLVGFSIRDEYNTPVPVLTRRQNGHVAWQGLNAYAAEVATTSGVVSAMPHAITKTLRVITQESPSRAERRLAALRSRVSRSAVVDVLLHDDGFVSSVEMLARNFLLIAALPAVPGARRILKFEYEESIAPELDQGDQRPRRQRLAESLGWSPTTVEIPVLSFLDCESFHFEATAPPGVELVDIVLGDEARVDANGEVDPKWAVGYRRVLEDSPHRAHLATSRTADRDVSQDEFLDPRISLRLRVERTGWLRASAFASVFVAVFLTASRFYLHQLNPGPASPAGLPDSGSGSNGISTDPASFTVALVGVVSLVVIRAGDHPYTAKLLDKLRLLAVVSALLPIVGAWLLVFGGTGRLLDYGWTVLTVVAWTLALVLFAVCRRSDT